MWTGVVNLLFSLVNALAAFLAWKSREARDARTQLDALAKADDSRRETDDARRAVPASDSLPDDGFRRD